MFDLFKTSGRVHRPNDYNGPMIAPEKWLEISGAFGLVVGLPLVAFLIHRYGVTYALECMHLWRASRMGRGQHVFAFEDNFIKAGCAAAEVLAALCLLTALALIPKVWAMMHAAQRRRV